MLALPITLVAHNVLQIFVALHVFLTDNVGSVLNHLAKVNQIFPFKFFVFCALICIFAKLILNHSSLVRNIMMNMHLISPLLAALKEQKEMGMKGGVYHKTQIDLTYNSNHIEGSKLTHEQTRYIFETNTIGMTDDVLNVNDILETVNHFRCIDLVIEHATDDLSAGFIKELHGMLKNGTSDSRKDWFAVGYYKRLPNEVGGEETCPPELVAERMDALLDDYLGSERRFEDILDLHVRFERIHPFQDGNGRVGRLVMFKECLANAIVPFIITDELKFFYYRQ